MKRNVLLLILGIYVLGTLVGCGSEKTEITQSSSNSIVQISENYGQSIISVQYSDYADVQDFGQTYGIEVNVDKQHTMKALLQDEETVYVYDVTSDQREFIDQWKKNLKESGYILTDENNSNDGNIITYTNELSQTQIVLSLANSTEIQGGITMILVIKPIVSFDVLPDKDDEIMNELVGEQGRAQNDSFIRIQDDWKYGITWSKNGDANFAKERSDGTDFTNLANWSVYYIYVKDAYVYFEKSYGDDQGIYKMRTSGEDRERIVEVDCPKIQVVSDYIYYSPSENISENDITDESNHLYCCKLDGSDVREVISKPVFGWFVFENGIIYQDDRDNESLHLFCLEDGTDVKLNDQKSYAPIYDGENIYYATSIDDSEDDFELWTVKPDGSDNRRVSSVKTNGGFCLYCDYVYFVNSEDDRRIYRIKKDGTELTQITQDKYIRGIHFEEDKLVYSCYSSDKYKYVEKIVICDSDGSNAHDAAIKK